MDDNVIGQQVCLIVVDEWGRMWMVTPGELQEAVARGWVVRVVAEQAVGHGAE